MINTYPAVRCQNPRRITNPYTGQTLIVPCGHCRACALNRSYTLTRWCDMEAECNKYVVFITLTYANRFIPRATICDSIERPFGYDLYDKETGEYFGACDMKQELKDSLLSKFYLFGDVPYLRKDDLQKFLKRFRYYAKKYSKDPVRYFAAGEYGPAHYRPHYHILLYFNSEALLQACSDIVSQSWPFGRTDTQLSEGKCSQYVASYVNSTCTVPKVFSLSATRPFVVHSKRLGFGLLEGQRKKVYEIAPEDFIRQGLQLAGKYREFTLPRSFYSFFYPKCKGYVDKSPSERAFSMRLYEYARKAFPDAKSTLDLARCIAASIYYFGTIKNAYGIDDKYSIDLCNYFNDGSYLHLPSLFCDAADKWITRIYSELLVSRHFLFFVCDTSPGKFPTYHEITRKLKCIDNFYSRLDYMHLLDFFDSQSVFFENYFYGDDDLMSDSWENTYCPYFYDNVYYSIDSLKNSLCYRIMSTKVNNEFADKIKHKELNDKNGIFLQD